MTLNTEMTDLSGKLLIAMPGMGDPRFDQSLILLCSYAADQSMGLIVNKPSENIRFPDLLEQLSITPSDDLREVVVHYGGPVEHGRGFVLHSTDYTSSGSTLRISDTLAMTATLDVLEDIARGFGPDRLMMALGYAGWGPGQLDSEISNNGWLICEADPEIIFDVPDNEKWSAALKTLGVDALALSSAAGSA